MARARRSAASSSCRRRSTARPVSRIPRRLSGRRRPRTVVSARHQLRTRAVRRRCRRRRSRRRRRRHAVLPARRVRDQARDRRSRRPRRATRRPRSCRCTDRSDAAEQDAALRPGRSSRRRIVVATNIAETSVTVPGVDGRRRFRAAQGRPLRCRARRSTVSRPSGSRADAADQRAGRAGRLGARRRRGACGTRAIACGRTASPRFIASICPPRCSISWPGAAIRGRSSGSSARETRPSRPR